LPVFIVRPWKYHVNKIIGIEFCAFWSDFQY
jgi:hypothetical protein